MKASSKIDEKKIKILKILPWISINFNAFIQILSLILIIILLKIIKSQNNSIPFGRTISSTNQIDNNQNFQPLSNNNNGNNQEFQKQKTKVKKRNKKNNMFSSENSEQIDLTKKKRIKQIEEKKKLKRKIKRKKK